MRQLVLLRLRSKITRNLNGEGDTCQIFLNLRKGGFVVSGEENPYTGIAVAKAFAHSNNIFESHDQVAMSCNNLPKIFRMSHICLSRS